MGLLCSCPLGTAIGSVTAVTCIEDIGQIQRIILQRLKDADGERVQFGAISAADAEATIDALLAAADDTKVVLTPILASPEMEPGASIEYGGGNATPGGVPISVGREATKITMMALRIPQTIIAQLKTLQCEKLQGYFINQHGQLIGETDGATPAPNLQGFEIQSLFIGDKKFGGFEEPDSNEVIIYLKPNWSDNLTVISDLDYDPLIKEYVPAP